MSYEPLHHKYRPQTFADLVRQEAIATTLSNAMRLRRIAPAYLLTRPRGTGKTSSARILAKSLNCIGTDVPTPEPCGVCEVCESITRGNALDVIEIDAARAAFSRVSHFFCCRSSRSGSAAQICARTTPRTLEFAGQGSAFDGCTSLGNL
jgi:DNA polymerase III, delta subunit